MTPLPPLPPAALDDRPSGHALDDLLVLLELERLEVNLFRGLSPQDWRQRVFGGQVAAQALVAAGRTVAPERSVHSLHAYFLRPGDPKIPIVYDVDRIRDGRSFTTRRVVAIQHGRPIFNLAAQFQVAEPGPEHSMPMPWVPEPETLPTWRQRVDPYIERMPREIQQWLVSESPIDIRPVEEPTWLGPVPAQPTMNVWMRAAGSVPDEPLLHACIAAYASDITLLNTATMPHAARSGPDLLQMASLDHAMWFHRLFRADDWLLYNQTSPSASAARGLVQGFVFRRDGALAVTVVQEGLVRPLRPSDAP